MTEQLSPWWRAIRHSWAIPDLLSDEWAATAIARKVIDPKADAEDTNAGKLDVARNLSWVQKYIEELRKAGEAGQLDLPICGLGRMSESQVTYDRGDPATEVRELLKNLVGPLHWWDAGADEVWGCLRDYVTEHPFD